MRIIGHLEEEHAAATFGDYLFVKGIENEIERQKDGSFAVWILSEEELDAARELLNRFRLNPAASEFQKASEDARRILKREEKEAAAAQGRVIDRSQIWQERAATTPHLTIALIVISVAVFVVSKMGEDTDVIRSLFITEYSATGGYIRWHAGLTEIRSGQVWRVFTPMFIHFGLVHILFNMLWLKDLGAMIERYRGSFYFGLLVLVIAVVSNVAQYVVSAPNFGGMSGVVYGLLGYIWMKGKYDPASGLFLHQTTVAMMMIWFGLCLTGLMGPIANTVHGVGLAIGVAWGYLSARRARWA